jgi:hypothetical protein
MFCATNGNWWFGNFRLERFDQLDTKHFIAKDRKELPCWLSMQVFSLSCQPRLLQKNMEALVNVGVSEIGGIDAVFSSC